MYENYLFGLRGGLEAGVVVVLLVAYAVRAGRRDALPSVGTGAGVAAALALGFGCALTFGSQELTPRARETLGATLSIAAAALLTWTVLAMRRTTPRTRSLLTATAFLAVGREAVETSLYLWASVRTSLDGSHGPLLVVLLGLLTALALCLLLHRGAVRVGLGTFLTWIGATLTVVAAGVLARGVRGLQEAELLGGTQDMAFDISAAIPPDSWYGALLRGALAFRPDPTVLQAAVWPLYLVPALVFFFAPKKATVPEQG